MLRTRCSAIALNRDSDSCPQEVKPRLMKTCRQSFRLISDNYFFYFRHSTIPRYFAVRNITYTTFVSTSFCVYFSLDLLRFVTWEPRPETDYCYLRWVLLYWRVFPADIHDQKVFVSYNCIQKSYLHSRTGLDYRLHYTGLRQSRP